MINLSIAKPNCEKCTLKEGVDKKVAGSGWKDRPLIVYVGSDPSTQDVSKGIPFSGEGGKFLRQTITAVDGELEKVYYTEACQCKVPKGKDPKAREIKACNARLMSELEAIKPDIIVPLGKVALSAVLGAVSISRQRGTWREITLGNHIAQVIPTYHPDSILKAPGNFRDFVADLGFIHRVLEGEAPVVDPPYKNYITIDNEIMFQKLLKRLKKVHVAAVDIETNGLDFMNGEILCMGFSWARETACILDWQALIKGNSKNLAKLNNAIKNVRFAYHHGQFDHLWLTQRGLNPIYYFDTMLAHYALDERQGVHGLKRLALDRYRAPSYDEYLKKMLAQSRRERKKAAGLALTEEDLKEEDDDVDLEILEVISSDEHEEFESAISNEAELQGKALKIAIEDWSDPVIRELIIKYNGADCDYTFRLMEDLSEEMEEEGLRHLHDDILIPAAIHFMEFEREGMMIDMDHLNYLDGLWTKQIAEIETKLRAYPGAEDMNFGSPKQVAKFLFDVLKLRPMGGGKVETITPKILLEDTTGIDDEDAQEYWKSQSSKQTAGMKARSSSTYMLYWLAQQHEWPRLLVTQRVLAKKKNTYCDGIRDKMWPDGRVRPHYKVHGTKTSRMSSTNPNIHGTPKKKEIKNIYKADPGWVIVAADYSQAEVRMMAHFANDMKLLEALLSTDIHLTNMKTLFKLTDEDVEKLTPEKKDFMRRAAKTIVFGIIYGRSAKGLAPQIGCSEKMAEAYISAFLNNMPDVRKHIEQRHQEVMRNQEVLTLQGFHRRFDLILKGSHSNAVKRQAVNAPIQGSVSVMTTLAYLRLCKSLAAKKIPFKRWPHIHDAVMIQVPQEYQDRVIELMINEMHDPGFKTKVPFAVELSAGPRWGDMKKLYEG